MRINLSSKSDAISDIIDRRISELIDKAHDERLLVPFTSKWILCLRIKSKVLYCIDTLCTYSFKSSRVAACIGRTTRHLSGWIRECHLPCQKTEAIEAITSAVFSNHIESYHTVNVTEAFCTIYNVLIRLSRFLKGRVPPVVEALNIPSYNSPLWIHKQFTEALRL